MFNGSEHHNNQQDFVLHFDNFEIQNFSDYQVINNFYWDVKHPFSCFNS